MKKLTIAALAIILTGGTLMLTAQAKDGSIKYRSVFDIKYAFCSIKTNGLVGQDNRSSAVAGRGFGTSSTAAMFSLENGENEISVEFSALDWFNPDIQDEKEKARFNPEAYCNLEFIQMEGSNYKTLTTLSVAIDKDGQPYAKESDVIMQVRKDKDVISGYIPDDTFKPEKYPVGMSIYEFKKKIVVNGLPEWVWIKAEEYKDTPEQRSKLQQAYEALWADFNRKDLHAIKDKFKIAMNTWAYSTGSTPDEIFQDWGIKERFEEEGYKMFPINWEGYDVLIMNKGRMVRLINKSNFGYSPIIQRFPDGSAGYAPTFSLINGEFVIVL